MGAMSRSRTPRSDSEREGGRDDSRRETASETTAGNRGRVTLQTIATALGVSRSTVSNAFSRPDQLAPALRERILRVAAELGYPGPHPVARTLRRGRIGALGLLLTEALTYAFRDPAAVLFLEGVAEELQEADLGLLLVPARPDHPFDPAAIRTALVDGFLVYSVSDGHPALEAVLRRRVPIVVVDQPRLPEARLVVIDDEAAAYGAAKHLVELGHRHFAILTDRLSVGRFRPGIRVGTQKESGFEVTRLRLNGYRRALDEAGVDWESVPVAECFPNAPQAGQQAVAMLLSRTPQPTAILSITDQLALGALAGAAAAGLAVPRDLSVVGFDDVPDAARAEPPLTTVRQPLLEKGRIAARLLTGPPDSAVRVVQLATELVVRGSTAPPPP
jgi:DNA-binding LacI/PurR family transcriptional regulator